LNPASTLLAQATAHHQAGRLDQAARLYARVLAAEPDQADALHLLGVIQQQRGDCQTSIALIERAIALNPGAAHYHCNLANALTGVGRFAQAAEACRRALTLDPNLAMAQSNLGVALRAVGRPLLAIDAFQAAIALQPERAEAYANLGVLLTEQGRREEAAQVLRRALAQWPDYAEAHFNLAGAVARLDDRESLVSGLAHYDRAVALRPSYAEAHANRAEVLRHLGRLEAAEAAFRSALDLAPEAAQTHYGLGLVLSEQVRPKAALEAFLHAIAIAPNFALAHSHAGNALAALDRLDEAFAAHQVAMNLAPGEAGVHHNLGLTLSRLALYEEAAEAQAKALAIDPDLAEAYANLAGCQAELGLAEAALTSSQRAIALKPALAVAHAGLGNALLEQDRLEEAEAAFAEALRLNPQLPQAHSNMGLVRFRQGRLEVAEAAYRRAVALRPEVWESRHNLGILLLERGQFEEGWREFEWRLQAAAEKRREQAITVRRWAGEDLAGKTILAYAEQGLGDMIQCARFLPELSARGARVVLWAPGSLRRLLSGVADAFVAEGEPEPPADLGVPLFSLPRLLGVTLERLPGSMPYLTADPDLATRWKARLEAIGPGPRVGVVWSGNATAKVDRGRSFPLRDLEPLAEAIGAPLISLQRTFGLGQLDDLPEAMSIISLGADYDAGDFAETAAVIANLDLVISCDTAVGHLAGALGRPAWLALNARSEWRWLHDRADSPWYPSLRLYRQPGRGDWRGVFKQMAADWRGSMSPR
jgi:tetratricopeptide (TPR) repeat protein